MSIVRKLILIVLSICFLFGMATKAEVKEEPVKDTVTDTVIQTPTQNEGDKGYRIEVSEEKLRGGKEGKIRFVSPEGDVLKNIRLDYSMSITGDLWHIESTNLEAISEDKSKVIISEKTRNSMYNPEELTDYPGYEGEIWNYTIKLMNSMGEVKFIKQFKTYPGNDPTASYWKTLFSKQGNTILFFYRDSTHVFHIEVYDMKGNKLAETSFENYLRNLQIAPDGKIVGAETEKKVGKAWLRHLFFLDVETGETKLVKAEGKGWRVSGFPQGGKKIELTLHEYPKSYILSFDELPKDLSTLFGDEK